MLVAASWNFGEVANLGSLPGGISRILVLLWFKFVFWLFGLGFSVCVLDCDLF